MAHTYSIKNGGLILVNGKPRRLYDLKRLTLTYAKLGYYFCVFAVTFIVVWGVYRGCITEYILERTISLGAVFATLGSSIVSILSLFCGEKYSQFNDNVRILQEQLIENVNWERWQFVKRVSKRKIGKGQYEYRVLHNPSIIFTAPLWKLAIALPTSKTDFSELPIYRNLLSLTRNRSRYCDLLSKHQSLDAAREIMVWDCLIALYKSIVLYRLGHMLIWLGACFVFNSIVFSFFFAQCMGFVESIFEYILKFVA